MLVLFLCSYLLSSDRDKKEVLRQTELGNEAAALVQVNDDIRLRQRQLQRCCISQARALRLVLAAMAGLLPWFVTCVVIGAAFKASSGYPYFFIR